MKKLVPCADHFQFGVICNGLILIELPYSTSCSENLAYEESLLTSLNSSELAFCTYINTSAIVIGRNQSIYREVNLWHCWMNNIPVFRRISGGGAVYHDKGNLNYSFIAKRGEKAQEYSFFLDHIILALESMGVKAFLNQKNDLIVNGKKISGTAQRLSKINQLCHGTLLFNTDLGQIEKALHHPKQAFITTALKSIEGKVLNLVEVLGKMNMEEFRSQLIKSLPITKYQKIDNSLNEKASAEKYCEEEWIYGRSPETNIQLSRRVQEYLGLVSLSINKGVLNSSKTSTEKGEYFVADLSQQYFTVENVYNSVLKTIGETDKIARELTKSIFSLV